MTDRLRALAGWLFLSLLSATVCWLALAGWQEFAVDTAAFLRPLAVAALLLAITAAGVRALWAENTVLGRVIAPALGQLLVGTAFLFHHITGRWWPSRSGVAEFGRTLRDGYLIAREHTSPIPDLYPEYPILLLGIGLLLIIGLDLAAVGTGQPSLAGLLLLLVVALGAAMQTGPLPAYLLLAPGLAWLILVAAVEVGPRLTRRWSHAESAEGYDPEDDLEPGEGRRWLRISRAALPVLTVSAIAATVLPAVVPDSRPVPPEGEGNGKQGLRLTNPVLDLGRNLNREQDLDVVSVLTTDPEKRYLRTTVLDEFTGTLWRPSPRNLGSQFRVNGALPRPSGLSPSVRTRTHSWSIRVANDFESSWLPLPEYPSAVEVDRDWRYGPETLDVTAAALQVTAAGLEYQASGLALAPSKDQLRNAVPPPARVRKAGTALPTGMSPVFETTAKRVTKGARNDYERAVLLQRWFRDAGGFRYSTVRAPGNGLSSLAKFISDERIGYCEQFAGAMALLARVLGIPSRVAVGFLSPETHGDVSTYSLHDLHAWPELYFQGVGWTRFEPTPTSRTGVPPDYTLGRLRARSGDPEGEEAPRVPAPAAPRPLPEKQAAPTATPAAIPTWTWWLAAGGVVTLLGAFGPRVTRRLRTRRRWARATSADALAEAAWAELRDTAIDAGVNWQVGRSPRTVESDLLHWLRPDAEARDALHQVISFVELTRYARPRPLSDQTREEVIGQVDRWREQVHEQMLEPPDRWWPKSVLSSVRPKW